MPQPAPFRRALIAALAGLAAAPAAAATATRCSGRHCEVIHCRDHGNHCTRSSGHRRHRDWYERTAVGTHTHARRAHVRHGRHKVCDPDGDRCYRSRRRHWNYREYYRRHGYHWIDSPRDWHRRSRRQHGDWHDRNRHRAHRDWRDNSGSGY